MRPNGRVACLFLTVSLCVAACRQAPPPPAAARAPEVKVDRARLVFFQPLPDASSAAMSNESTAMVELGRMLFFEPRLSKSQTISCNSCHDLSKYGVDGEPTSEGHKGQRGDRNSPTVFNASLHFAQFWDGRADTIEAQAKGPVLNPVEMAMPAPPAVIRVLESMPEYVDAFRKAFRNDPRPITYDHMAAAIGAFERRLTTPSRWDAFLKGDEQALTPAERTGLNLFLDTGCQACHGGALLGGLFYQKLGAAKPFPRNADPGRFKVTKAESDRGVFKVPSLRNVDKTAPYFHDGATASLEQAVRDMAEFQLGKTLTPQQTKEIVDFLKALTGTVDGELTKPPVLPKSTPATPKPDMG